MEPHQDEPIYQLARVLFGAYNAKSGGKAHDGKPVPNWGEIREREEREAKDAGDPVSQIWRRDGVIANWCAVAEGIARIAQPWAVIHDMATAYEHDAVYQRSIADDREV